MAPTLSHPQGQSSVYGETAHATVAEPQAGQRLDRFLAAAMPALSRSRLQALIAQGRVALGGKTIKDGNRRVKLGEVYALDLPPPAPVAPAAQAIALSVVYEDDDLIVVDKPAGMVVHPAAGNPDGTLVNALLAHCGDSLKGIGGETRPGIVHRLDKDTSGLLVAAKNERVIRSLAKQFAAHAITREYCAMVWGAPRADEGTVEGNLGRNPFDRKRMAVLRRAGKPARTHYRVREPFGRHSGDGAARALAALLACTLETGRTHQIRVHLAHIGHPLIGDATYGRARQMPRPRSDAEERAFALMRDFPRQALHAGVLGFFHPSLQKTMRFESPWPADFAGLVDALRDLGIGNAP